MKVDKLFDVVQPKETDKLDDEGKPITRWQNLGIAFYKDGNCLLYTSPSPRD